jgi:NAD(P)-dependent dehydrogenase (short-subunit alcohol dehydrogenase family)
MGGTPNTVRGRNALVTGGSRRIGAAIARMLAADGWRVIVHYNRSAEAAEQLVAEITASGGACQAIQADLSRQDGIEGLIGDCVAAHGRLDCLINNASSFFHDDIRTVTWDSLNDLLKPNLMAPVLLSRDFAAQFDLPEGGCIVNLLDQKIDNLNPDFLSYTLAKVAMGGLTEMMAMALAPRIRVCGVAPGLTMISGKQTEESFQRAWRSAPMGRSSTPEEVAACVRFILSMESMTGETIFVDGGESLRGRPRDVAFDPALASRSSGGGS